MFAALLLPAITHACSIRQLYSSIYMYMYMRRANIDIAMCQSVGEKLANGPAA